MESHTTGETQTGLLTRMQALQGELQKTSDAHTDSMEGIKASQDNLQEPADKLTEVNKVPFTPT